MCGAQTDPARFGVRTGLVVLGRIHVAATGLVQAVAAGTRRIRAWRPTPAEARLADLADQLAATGAELRWALQLTGRIPQLQDALTGRLPIKGSPPGRSHD
jgi:hypothetical protein